MTEPHTTDQLARMVRDQIVRNAAQGVPCGRHHRGEGRTPATEMILSYVEGWAPLQPFSLRKPADPRAKGPRA